MGIAIAADAATIRRRPRWSATRALSLLFGLFTLAVLTGSIAILLWQSVPVWQHAGWDYLVGRHWFYRDLIFGAASMIYGTVVVAMIALVLAAPVAVGSGVF